MKSKYILPFLIFSILVVSQTISGLNMINVFFSDPVANPGFENGSPPSNWNRDYKTNIGRNSVEKSGYDSI